MADAALRRSLPSWVEFDPVRGRAVDALGLQQSADRIADRLLPGLAVTTTRARYYSLLTWARRTCGKRADEDRIHRLEVALAVREAMLHPKTSEDVRRCRFVGSRNLPRAPHDTPYDTPPEPHRAYRVPVWRAYRASMQSLGLLDDGYALTADYGSALAKAFSAACKPDASGRVMLPKSACLSRITRREGALLETLIGIRKKGKRGRDDVSPESRRGAVERELRRLFDNGLSLPTVLAAYETRPDREPSLTVSALREAAVWERLSVGLHATFLLWLAHIRAPNVAKAMLVAARRRPAAPHSPFANIGVDDTTGTRAIQSIRRALVLRDRLAKRNQLPHCDLSAFELGSALVGTTPIEDVLAQLEARHSAAKGDDAWIRPRGSGKELARDANDRWELPAAATLHGYRLPAFGQILADLRLARG